MVISNASEAAMTKPQLVATTEFKIEKGVPMPERRRNIYPFNDMQPGDSFFVATGKPDNFIRNIYPKNRDGKRFLAKKVDGGVRVWRTA